MYMLSIPFLRGCSTHIRIYTVGKSLTVVKLKVNDQFEIFSMQPSKYISLMFTVELIKGLAKFQQ